MPDPTTNIEIDHVEAYIAAVADALEAAQISTDDYTIDPDETYGAAIDLPNDDDDDHGIRLIWNETTGWSAGWPDYGSGGTDCLTAWPLGLIPPPEIVVRAAQAAVALGVLTIDVADDIPEYGLELLATYAQEATDA